MKALMLLYGIRTRASIRRLFRGMKTPKGAMVTIFAVGLFSMMFVPNIILRLGHSPLPTFDILTYAPLGLFAYLIFTLLTSMGEKAIYFSPSEIDLLFTAPFSRRQLLAYKMVGLLITSCFMAFIIVCAMAIYFPNLFFAFVGVATTFLFLALSAMLVTLLGQVIAEHVYSRGRQLIALILLVLFGVAMLQALGKLDFAGIGDFQTWASAVSESAMGRIVLAPFNPFCYAMTAESFAKFVPPMCLSAVINACLIGGILLLDANYLETAVRVSQKIYEQSQRIRKSGGVSPKLTAKSMRWRISMLPSWDGFGPLAWRQLVLVLRQSKGVMIIIGIVVACLGLPLIFDVDVNKATRSPMVVAFVFGSLCYITTIFSLQSPFGFRADIDHIEVFKSLPMRSFYVAAGELVGAVSLFVAFHWAVAMGGMIVSRNWIGWWLTGMAFSIPFNLLVFSVANGLFLLYPIRMAAGSKDIQTVGQAMIFMFCQMIILMLVAALCLLPGGLVYWLTDNLIAAGLIAWLFLSVAAVAGIGFTCWAYDKFDVSQKPV